MDIDLSQDFLSQMAAGNVNPNVYPARAQPFSNEGLQRPSKGVSAPPNSFYQLIGRLDSEYPIASIQPKEVAKKAAVAGLAGFFVALHGGQELYRLFKALAKPRVMVFDPVLQLPVRRIQK
jgi:hypothetical protein